MLNWYKSFQVSSAAWRQDNVSAHQQAPLCEYPEAQRAGGPFPAKEEVRKRGSGIIAASAPLFAAQPDSRVLAEEVEKLRLRVCI